MSQRHLHGPENYTKLINDAIASERQRSHMCIHDDGADPIQRIVIAMTNKSLVVPHRHVLAHQTETLIALKGNFTVLIFDDALRLSRKLSLDGETGDIYAQPANVWHSLICESETGVFFEIKGGPYDAQNGAEMLADAPQEGTEAANHYLAKLRALSTGDHIQ